MEKITGNEQAFPIPKDVADQIIEGYGFPNKYLGLTIRQHFAAMAMQGMLSACKGYDNKGLEYLAKCAVQQSDALIAELNKPIN